MDVQDIISSGLLELYAAGLTSNEEQKQVEYWVKQYPEVATELNVIESSIELYAQGNSVEPGKAVKEKIFAAINTTPSFNAIISDTSGNTQAKIISLKNNWRWVAAASIVLFLASATMNMMYYNKYDTVSKDLKETQQQLAAVEEKNTEIKPWADAIHDPNSTSVSLKETGATPGATAKIFWMKNTGDVMIDASNLPDAPVGMQYQFWGIVDSKPVDGGLIITNDKGKKFLMQKMKSFGRAEAFAISLEKEGGNATPTKVVSLGKII